ncbi:MAG: hypothetical protein RI101_01955 [Nitrospira sp.]|jgi:hypothetical protein|nr:hypothetical protein [Nitrospira sp.]
MTPMCKLLAAGLMSLTIGNEIAASAATLPNLPQTQVDVTMPTVTGSTLTATCSTLQAQLNAAAVLDVNLTHQIILATGTTCTGPYVLPSHNGGTGWILIKGANYSSLPASGTRVTTADAALMPQIQYGEDANVAHVGCFSVATGGQRYRIIGIDCVENATKVPNWAMITTGYASSGATNTGYIILDRMIIRDRNPSHTTLRGVYGDAQRGNTALVDSLVIGIKATGSDTQAWLSVNNPGPILIQNNFMQSTGENFMTCGASPMSDALQPRDITIKFNLLSKDSAWWGSTGWLVKTLLELKCGVRILIEANTLENMPWNDGGYAHRLTPRNDSYSLLCPSGPGCIIELSDLTIRYNLYRNVTNWINSIAADDGLGIAGLQTKHSKRWYIHNNLVYGLGWSCGGGASCGAIYNIVDGASGSNCQDYMTTCKMEDLTIAHNTIDDGTRLFCVTTNGQIALDFRDNLINNNAGRGLFDCGGSTSSNYGTTRLNEAWSGTTWNWKNNRIAMTGNGESIAQYPQGTNSYPTSYTNFLWTDRVNRDYTLQAGSPAKNTASDGTDQGVNFSVYNAVRSGGSASAFPSSTVQNVTVTVTVSP